MSTEAIANIAFQLKGGLFPLTTLQIFSTDLHQLREQLVEKIQQAPNFFKYAPIVLDLKIANQPSVAKELEFSQLKTLLQELKLVPVGIKNANHAQAALAQSHGFAVLRDTPNPREEEKLTTTPQSDSKNH